MPYAYLDGGTPVEIVPGAPFTTPQLKITSEEDAVYSMQPLGSVIAFPVQHPANALDGYGPDELERFCIQAFEEPAAPEGQVRLSRSLGVTGGVIGVIATFGAPPVPQIVSRDQAWAELEATPSPVNPGKTLFDDVCAAVDTSGDAALKAYFMGSKDYHRTNPRLLQAAGLISLVDVQIDQLFIGAAQRSA